MDDSSGHLQDLTDRFEDRARIYEIEVSTEKSKIKNNGLSNINADRSMNGWKLEEVSSFK